jgi:Mn-dependent DtxR family transcriptional regulator
VSEEVTEELKEKILKYLETVSKARNREVARAIDVEKSLVDKAIGELGNEGKIEYLFLGASYIKLKDKEG